MKVSMLRAIAMWLAATFVAFLSLIPAVKCQQTWPVAGVNFTNSHALNSPDGPNRISPDTVSNLKVRWFYPTTAGVSATPTVETGGVYFVVQDGSLVKLDPLTGALLWKDSLPSLINVTAGGSTTSPAIAGDRIVVAINGYVLALNKMTGALIWKTLVESHPLAKVHASPIVVNGHIFTGTASTEEAAVLQSGYLPTFRGSAVSLNLATGAIEWKTYMVPLGYTGGGIWSNTPAVDVVHNMVFFTNGNNYTLPQQIGLCVRDAGRSIASQRACLDPTDFVDSFIALNMTTGAVVWTRPTVGADAWLPVTFCANPGIFICPTVNKPYDADFAQGPMLFYVHNFIGVADDRGGHSNGFMLGAGQKTGVFWALNPVNGGVFWSTPTANVTGELKWGSAVDTSINMIYTALDNSSPTLGNDIVGRKGIPIKNSMGGVWSGLDAATGTLVFQIPGYGKALNLPTLPGNTPGGLSVANGLIFGGATSGYMVAFDSTGQTRWSFYSGGVVVGSPSVVNELVYWGTGNYRPPVPNQTFGLYCFSLPS